MIAQLLERYIDNFRGLSREVWLLTFISLINRAGTIVVLFLSIYMTEELGFTKTQAGIAMGCFGGGSFVGAYLGGYLTDRIGYFKVMFWSLVISGFCFFILMYMTTVITVCLMVFLTSASGDMFRPASSASFASYSSKENHTRALSLYRLAINLGFAVGGAAAGLIADRFGYDWLFIIDGVSCILAGIALMLLLKELPDKELGEAEDAPLPEDTQSVYSDYWFLAFCGMLLLSGMVFMQIFSSFPVYAREDLFLSKEQIGYIMAANGILICVFEMPLVSWITNRKKNMESIILGTFLIGFAFFLLGSIPNVLLAIALYVVAITFGEIISFPFSTTIALHRSQPGNRGQYMGLYALTFSMSFILGNSIGLYIADQFGFIVLWMACAVLVLISVFGLMLLKSGNRDLIADR